MFKGKFKTLHICIKGEKTENKWYKFIKTLKKLNPNEMKW